MRLKESECKVMYTLDKPKDIPKKEYIIEENESKMVLKVTDTEKDLGVIIKTNSYHFYRILYQKIEIRRMKGVQSRTTGMVWN